VRGFIKACLTDKPELRYGIPIGHFENYQNIIDFVYKHTNEVKLSYSSLSHLKNRNTISRTIPRTPDNEKFIEYVKQEIPSFNDDLFFKEFSYEVIRKLKEEKKKNS
jgi:hypothetical protein